MEPQILETLRSESASVLCFFRFKARDDLASAVRRRRTRQAGPRISETLRSESACVLCFVRLKTSGLPGLSGAAAPDAPGSLYTSLPLKR